jgi:3D (Asp-Asp-Asp) domain-containing protein
MRNIRPLKAALALFVAGHVQIPNQAAATTMNMANGLAGNSLVRTTAYTQARHAPNASDSPLQAGEWNSAAADWSRFPLGTKFKVAETNRTYVVDDYGSALVGTNTIDLYMPSGRQMRQWGVRNVTIEIVEAGSFERSLAVLKARSGVPYVRKMVKRLEQKL